jgi:hypothetical protein
VPDRRGAALTARSADGRLGNAFTVRITNRGGAAQRFRLALDDTQAYELIAGLNPIPVAGASSLETRVFVLAQAGTPADGHEIRFVLEPESGGARLVRTARFVATGGGHGG